MTSPRVRVCADCRESFALKEKQPGQTKRCPPCMAKFRTRVCPTCGITFTSRSNQPQRRFCSQECWGKSPKNLASFAANKKPPRPPKICPTCKAEFKPKHRNPGVYCSRECWRASDRPAYKRGQAAIRWLAMKAREAEPPPPDEDEITTLTAEIRAGWSEAEEQERLRPDWRRMRAVLHRAADAGVRP